jgi:hypothetical protein
MMGDIFGRIAGLGCVEVTLFLFLLLRDAFASPFLPFPEISIGLVGELTALISGLGLPCIATAAEGELMGASFATFLEIRFVFSEGCISALAGSGSEKSSRVGLLSCGAVK